MIWSVFVSKGAEGQKTAVRLLGQVDAPGASRALALLALMSVSTEARREAAQTLRNRDARDFAPSLIGLIRDPIRYEAKPAQGLGQSGELVIKDGTTNRKRIYTPLAEPNVPMQPGDTITMGADGLPVVSRQIGEGLVTMNANNPSQLAWLASMMGFSPQVNPARASAVLEAAGLPVAQSQKLAQGMGANSRNTLAAVSRIDSNPLGNAGGIRQVVLGDFVQIPIGEMELDAVRSAQVARLQLAGDVRAIEAYNAPILDSNRRVRQVLAECVGTDKGDDHNAWFQWMVDLFGFAYAPQKSSDDQTTVIEQVPIDYQPQANPPVVQTRVLDVFHHACFGAGTPVQTIDGPRSIEDLRAGDEVLTQDPRSGALRYQAMVEVYHNPPNATFRIEVDGESIVATGIHRLWKAGKGWTMVRELKAGDVLRTLGGTAAVKAVVEEKVQPVFNLRVAEGESYFVGRSGVLAHDNSMINPTPEPFDVVARLVDPAPAKLPASGR